ncbi:ParB/RepB/Spo0J family partition protein [Deinococcus alpinitundrae]|uniref:ParB/RepB/Spo0J family partition protein n=1 Tax=Deinococcus alpinitundrae TaxID=468913 RepID=UPI001379A3DC|nr:ParB/RepB/Spo0J family partition protein [Deinococcus alpinitundrae]
MTKNRFQKPTQKPGSSLGSLLSRSLQLSGAALPAEPGESGQQMMPLSTLMPNSRQPRRFFDPVSLQQLAESLKVQGVLQPLMVRPLDAGHYEIVYGERRWRAAQLAGLTEVPVLVRELSVAEAETISAVENLQREDLNRYDEVTYKLRLVAQLFEITPIEAVQLLKQLRAQPDSQPERITQIEHLFAQLGREQWRSFVTNGLPALRLPELIASAVQNGSLDYSKAVLLARAPQQHHKTLLRRVLDKNLTHAELREVLAKLEPVPGPGAAPLATIKRQLSARRLNALPADRRQRAEALLSELAELLND